MSDQLERVFTVTGFYDGPLEGIANFQGTPHAYARMFDYEQDEYSNIYQLKPVDADTLQLALEQWDIWLRWQAAFHRKEVGLESHPALPAERNRYEELKRIRAPALEVPEDVALKAIGEFQSEMQMLWRPLA
jgi:hypothetical protein